MTTETYNVVGKPTRRPDGPEKVTGAGVYSPDLKLDGMLWGRSLRSPYPHARIVRIDTSRAKDAPGVHAVLTGDDVRGIRYGRRLFDVPVLANDRVRFIGERIVAVAADSKDEADAALALVDVEYEEIPAVFDVDTGLGPGAPILHPEFNEYTGVAKTLDSPTNGFSHDSWTVGDIDAGFANSDVIVEATYETPKGHQGYLEPHSCVVAIDGDGRAQIWASNKAPFLMRQQLSTATGEDTDAFRVNHAYIGGDFGGKGSPMEIPLAYYLSKASKRPVKIVMDYSEELSAMNPRHASEIRIKAGVKRDGTLTAWDAEGWFPTGGYAAYAPVPVLGGLLGTTMVNSYRIPSVRIVGHQAYTNTVPGGYFRGPGIIQALFASESHLDVLATEISMDPLDLRLTNAITSADQVVDHGAWKPQSSPGAEDHQRVRLTETLHRAAEVSGYHDPRPDNVGYGIAVHEATDTGFDTHAAVNIHEDGTIVANMSVFDPGVGTGTMLAQIIAEELGVDPEGVQVVPWDTRGPRDWGVGGQRGARTMTQAAFDASINARDSIGRLAAEYFGWAEERLRFANGKVVHEPTGESVALGEIAGRNGEPVVGRGSTDEPRDTAYVSFAVHVAKVEVDPETGEVNLVKYTATHETGRVVNLTNFEGQIEGGSIQGIGQAMTEELRLEDGRVTNPTLADYKIPNIRDIPEFEMAILDSDVGNGPYKVRGVGDMPIVLAPAAIANAIADAIGVRVTVLPLTAEKVYRELRSLG